MTDAQNSAVEAVANSLLTEMRRIARQDGWALAAHGSMKRDLDVVAVPWTEAATDETAFVEAMRAAVARELQGQAFIGAGDDRRTAGHETKPHGRRSWTIHGISDRLVESEAGAHPYVDLAVMDFRAALPAASEGEAVNEAFLRLCEEIGIPATSLAYFDFRQHNPTPSDHEKLEGWQLIETAPKDGWGAPLLTCRVGINVSWFGDEPVAGYGEPPEAAYWNEHGDCWTPCQRPHDEWKPTHWMPLPSVPVSQSAAEPMA